MGLGSIGVEVARRAAAFDMRVLATTRSAREQTPPNVGWIGTGVRSDLDHLLAESDFVLLTCPLTEETNGLIDSSEPPVIVMGRYSKQLPPHSKLRWWPGRLATMKPGAVLINVARGQVRTPADSSCAGLSLCPVTLPHCGVINSGTKTE